MPPLVLKIAKRPQQQLLMADKLDCTEMLSEMNEISSVRMNNEIIVHETFTYT